MYAGVSSSWLSDIVFNGDLLKITNRKMVGAIIMRGSELNVETWYPERDGR
jgi:hypothetical protein